MTRVGVPGKLLLAGEYSVLLPGHACAVAAVERRLFVDSVDATEWRAVNGGARWEDGGPVPDELRFVVAAIDAVRARFPASPKAFSTRDEMSTGAGKLGLGGSAAATVAATFAAAQGTGATREELWAIADEVHRRVQGGKGSGADVAASTFGGVVHYSKEPRQAARIAVHDDVRLVAVWTGASVKTAPRLERFHAFVREQPQEAKRFCELSDRAVEALESGLKSGDSALIRGAMAQARAALKGLEAACGLELETPKLRIAADLAWQAGAAGKLSGSGGGDCAVVLAVGDDLARKVVDELAKVGLDAFPLAFADEGVRVEKG